MLESLQAFLELDTSLSVCTPAVGDLTAFIAVPGNIVIFARFLLSRESEFQAGRGPAVVTDEEGDSAQMTHAARDPDAVTALSARGCCLL